MYIYLNNELLSSEEAVISPFDHGYLYGVGLFETFRTFEQHPFLLKSHLLRLHKSCQMLHIHWEPDEQKLLNQIEQLLCVNELEEGYFRLNVSAGQAPIGLPSSVYKDVTEILFVKPLPPPSPNKKLVTVPTRRNSSEGPLRLKSHHYLNNILAKRETPEGYEGIMLTEDGYVAEGVVSNLFFIKQNKLYTPEVQSTGILNGITRQWVIKVAELQKIPVIEGRFTLQEVQQADELFITNSIQGLVPVSEWDQYTYDIATFKQLKAFNRIYEKHQTYGKHIDDLQLSSR